jgi:hypothetical protein
MNISQPLAGDARHNLPKYIPNPLTQNKKPLKTELKSGLKGYKIDLKA